MNDQGIQPFDCAQIGFTGVSFTFRCGDTRGQTSGFLGHLREDTGLTAIVYADEPTNIMPKDSDIPRRNRNHTGWWIFREVQQWVSDGQKKLSDHSRCPVWENTRLLRAKNRKKACKKAMKLCQAGHPSKTNGGEWRSAGISMLLPVYDEIEDGAEILWTDHGLMTVRKIQMLIKTKDQLPVFNDKDET